MKHEKIIKIVKKYIQVNKLEITNKQYLPVGQELRYSYFGKEYHGTLNNKSISWREEKIGFVRKVRVYTGKIPVIYNYGTSYYDIISALDVMLTQDAIIQYKDYNMYFSIVSKQLKRTAKVAVKKNLSTIKVENLNLGMVDQILKGNIDSEIFLDYLQERIYEGSNPGDFVELQRDVW